MPDLDHALNALEGRVSSLREARAAYPADLGPTLDAALAELDTAAELLAEAREQLGKAPRRSAGKKDGSQRELKLLRQVFRAFPVPVIVLDGGGMVRRINPETSRMLGSPDGYLVGRSFPLLVDVSRRAAFRSHLTSVLQIGQPAAFETRLAHQGRTHTVQLAISRLTMPGEPQQMVAVVALPTRGAAARAGLPAARTVRRRAGHGRGQAPGPAGQDGQAAAGRGERSASRSRCPEPTRLLAAEWADWVIADMVRDGLPRRSVVAGPKNLPVAELTRQVEATAPAGAQVVTQVLERRSGVVHEMVDDETLLGFCAEGPLLTVMGAGSLLCVPIGAGDGVLTLVRAHDRPPFTLADLGVMQESGCSSAWRCARRAASRAARGRPTRCRPASPRGACRTCPVTRPPRSTGPVRRSAPSSTTCSRSAAAGASRWAARPARARRPRPSARWSGAGCGCSASGSPTRTRWCARSTKPWSSRAPACS